VRFELKVLNNGKDLPIPKYQTNQAAGLDIYSANPEKEEIKILPGEYKLIPTGISIGLPKGYEAQIRPRSGLAAKHGITVLNTPGTIDSDYRGEISVILINLGKNDFNVARGMRIAQMIISPVSQFKIDIVDELDTTSRGEKGFGSTGEK